MKNEDDAIRNRISDDFDKRRISQPKTQQTNQPWIREESWWQLYFILYIQWKKTVKNITSWQKTLSASAVKVNKFQDAAFLNQKPNKQTSHE